MSAASITLPAFAKINWSLRILGRRPDGYHEIDTFLQTISLHDTIHFTATETAEIRLSCDDQTLPIDARNLVYRAAAALQSSHAQGKGARIHLEKRIPSHAGLGGGSSDAAATLIGLSHIWKIEASSAQLNEIAGNLGADVPFFLHGGTGRGTGIGTRITPLADADKRFPLIIKPNAGVSTAESYRALNAPSLTTLSGDTILSSSPSLGSFDSDLVNDFEGSVFKREPEINRAKAALKKAGAQGVMLAGSGSAVFGIFDKREAQERAIQAIELEPGWRVFPCTTVGRDQYRRAMGPCSTTLARLSEGMNAGA